MLSSKDVLGVMPELVEIIQERALIEGEKRAEENAKETEEETALLAGNCARCGVWSDNLEKVDGEYLCEDCRVEVESEE